MIFRRFLGEGGNWRIELLNLCGLDWEKLLTSGLVPPLESEGSNRFLGNQDPGRVWCPYGEAMLSACGSTFAARALLAVEERAFVRNLALSRSQGRPFGQYVRYDVISRFITPGDIPEGTQPEVAKDVQQELLALVLDDLRQDKEYVGLGNSLRPLARLQRPEIKEAIRPLLDSRFDYVVQEARRAFSIMGAGSHIGHSLAFTFS